MDTSKCPETICTSNYAIQSVRLACLLVELSGQGTMIRTGSACNHLFEAPPYLTNSVYSSLEWIRVNYVYTLNSCEVTDREKCKH